MYGKNVLKQECKMCSTTRTLKKIRRNTEPIVDEEISLVEGEPIQGYWIINRKNIGECTHAWRNKNE